MSPDRPAKDAQPARSNTLWSRGIFLFGMMLLVSFGLCGLNFVAVFGVNVALSGPAHNQVRQTVGITLVSLGYVELFGMLIGLIGLVISLLGAAITSLTGRNKT